MENKAKSTLEPTKVFVPTTEHKNTAVYKDDDRYSELQLDHVCYVEEREMAVLTPEQLEEHSCGFSEWMDIVAIRDGQHEWKYKRDNYAKKYTTKELYQLYLKEEKIKP